ncbi:hypothetical protein Pint_11482 [Pistacia integerrima]|uniref:Uncharacterized protein n=1 Tax=Pistacia integerrima TaxID=434235 RepID=A0ACC0XH82_9ROSI|nr:hypothetical protein Pint_11482 [Pistacia integerrima]
MSCRAIGSNNFSGALPSELGSLVKLEEIYIDSSGVSGEIPSTFANLRNMQIMWAYDCSLSGKIPDFIGNWTKLTSLRFGGNSFEGPIPSSFSNLSSLVTLQITDINSVSSSLDFIKNMKNLTDLSLRNALINGSIPSNIGEYKSLQTLDLSFNNLIGQIPSALFSVDSLTHLFLGNNGLSGTLPQQKAVYLKNIDLSYNYLSGTFPSWVTTGSQQLIIDLCIELNRNLVANNFTFDSSNVSILPGLNCLQRNFPCNKNSPRYSSFAIKCGGEEMKVDSIVYEADSYDLGGASFVVLDTQKWAISDAGLFSDGQFNTHVQNTGSQVTGTATPKLYQSSRQSPGSLRYYGLSLENGPYNVSLSFAETVFGDQGSQTWTSLGRRVFDIYIQGTLQLKDFDISKEAGGERKAITKKFNANVSENYLEIHLFWAGKGTCCIPDQGSYGPLVSALSVIPDFTPTVGIAHKKNQTALIVGIAVALGISGLILIFLTFYMRTKRHNDDAEGKAAGAWNLHEVNQSLELIDSKLSEYNEIEALRVIKVALLCTQASPMLRPTMSRVVNMLAGDIEVATVTSKPSYLTDWNYKDITNSLLNEETVTSSSTRSYSRKKSQCDSATDLSPGVYPLLSPENATRFNDIIAEGR